MPHTDTDALDINAGRLARGLTLRVRLTGLATWRLRLTLGGWLLWLAARVMGCRLDVEA